MMQLGDGLEIGLWELPGTSQGVIVRAGFPKVEHIVPPAGEDYAFYRKNYPVTVEVAVSPKGRSVRVYVNGKQVPT